MPAAAPAPPGRTPPSGPRRRRPANPKRRLLVVLLAMLVAFGLVGARLIQVQGISSERYLAFGESQRVRARDLPADRGSIFDRNGQDLALTVRQATVTANPRLVTDPLSVATKLAPILQSDPADLQSRLTRDAAFVYLARQVDDTVAQQVEGLQLPGITLIDEPKRFLPAAGLAAPLIGRVGTDNIGLSGLEIQFNQQLAGRPGKEIRERDQSGRKIPGGVRHYIPPVRGDDLVLTLDRSVQYEAERALAAQITQAHAKGGMAIVMQTRTGDVLAMANLVADPAGGAPKPSEKNMALTNVFEPGSVNKVITIAGALEEEVVQPDTRLSVGSTIQVSDHLFKEHDPHPVEEWSITEILANSSNVGSIMVGQKLGKERIDHYLRAFGFGRKSGLAFPGESAGILLNPKKWYGTSIGTVPIGQGLAVTGMQMLGAYNTIANGGVYVAPRLVRATVDTAGRRHPAPESPRRRVISARTAQQVTAMLNEVVRVGTGTRAAIDGYTVAGKTGTARKPLEGARGYEAGAYVSSFAGFVPSERPELTTIVILDEPTPIYGGLVAAPAFADISRYALRQFRIPPPPAPPAASEVPKATADSARPVGEVGAPASQPAP